MKKQLKINFLFAVLFMAAACFMGCEGDEGPAGPAGETGATGTAGATGSTGAAGPGYSSVVLTMDDTDESVGKSTYIVQSNATRIFSNMNVIVVKGQYYNPSNTTNQRMRLPMYFDVTKAQLPADAVIVDAILTLYPSNRFLDEISNFMCHFAIHPISAEWNETNCSWNNAVGGTPATPWTTSGGGGDYSATTRIGEFSVIPTEAVAEALPIQAHLSPAYVQNWKNGHANYGFIIKHDDESGSVQKGIVIHSRKADDASLRPSLRIIYARTSQMAADMSVEGIRAEYQTSLQSK